MTKTCSHIESFLQLRQPKLSNIELVALSLTAEYMSYNSELQLFRAIKGAELDGKKNALTTINVAESLLYKANRG